MSVSTPGFKGLCECSTSLLPPGPLSDGVGKFVELQEHSRASWELEGALRFSLHVVSFCVFFHVAQRHLRSSGEFLLRREADQALLQRLVGHVERLLKHKNMV